MTRFTGQLFGTDLTQIPEYRCVLLDPPWPERGGGQIKRGADKHYVVADVDSIRSTVLTAPWRVAEHAHCWLWVTANYLEDGLRLMRAMDFEYVRPFVWVKTTADGEGLTMGLGQYARGAHELLLFGVRGSGQDESVWKGARDVRDVFLAPHPREGGRIIHSRKPPESYELIERVSKGPRVELFARVQRVATDGQRWDVWGNEVEQGAA